MKFLATASLAVSLLAASVLPASATNPRHGPGHCQFSRGCAPSANVPVKHIYYLKALIAYLIHKYG